MLNLFGLPIVLSFVAGILFPYVALASSSYAFAVLFFMMVLAWMEINPALVFRQLNILKYPLLAGLFFHLMFFPLLQWFLVNALITEESFRYGLILASLCPVAIVVPQFTRLHKGDVELAYAMMIATMILFPLAVLGVAFWGADLFNIKGIGHIHLRPIIIDMLILILGPVPIGLFLQKFMPVVVRSLKSQAGHINMLAISFLAFTYMGASVAKINLDYTPWKEILFITLIMLLQDFGVYFLARKINSNLFSYTTATALDLSVATKNFAVSGAILLFYDPKASLASAIGFFIHALFFNFIILTKKP